MITYENVLFKQSQPHLVKLLRIDSNVHDIYERRHQVGSKIEHAVPSNPRHTGRQMAASTVQGTHRDQIRTSASLNVQPSQDHLPVIPGALGTGQPSEEVDTGSSPPLPISLMGHVPQSSSSQSPIDLMDSSLSEREPPSDQNTIPSETMMVLERLVLLTHQYLISLETSVAWPELSQMDDTIRALLSLLYNLYRPLQQRQSQHVVARGTHPSIQVGVMDQFRIQSSASSDQSNAQNTHHSEQGLSRQASLQTQNSFVQQQQQQQSEDSSSTSQASMEDLSSSASQPLPPFVLQQLVQMLLIQQQQQQQNNNVSS
jgi:hypothetical protein